jgi:ATP-dependent DNA helicase RecQ
MSASQPAALADPLVPLRQVFGLSAFRPHQQDIIERMLRGEDAFVLMPTGGGKSLCYQLPALLRDGVGLVISPLISLMKDQVDALRNMGVRAAMYNSSLDAQAAADTLAQLRAGELDLLYVAPERAMRSSFAALLAGQQVALIAIDEAHCVSQWGHDFRPEYAALGSLAAHFPGVPRIALTATADPQTRADIVNVLGLQSARTFITSFDRPNIRYTVLEKHQPQRQLFKFLDGREGQSGIVYALSRKRVEEVAGALKAQGYAAEAYHAGLPDSLRAAVQERFLRDETEIVVATVAFGMGIDKPNVRFVVHYDLPRHLEGYYQETGRAGRDGLAAEALLLFGSQDVATARYQVEQGNNEDQKRIESHKLSAMTAFAESLSCRRRVLLGYLGEEMASDCGNCDVCLDPPERFDGTEAARKVLSCVYRVGQSFGIRHVVDVLRGADNERIRRFNHERLSTYGIGMERPASEWLSITRQLIHQGYLYQDIAAFSVLKLTRSAADVLRDGASVELARPRTVAKAGKKRTRVADVLGQADQALFEDLRALRKLLAEGQGVPPYVVFGDASLLEMSQQRPASEADFLAITGVGQKKLERYGAAFLDVISSAPA